MLWHIRLFSFGNEKERTKRKPFVLSFFRVLENGEDRNSYSLNTAVICPSSSGGVTNRGWPQSSIK